MTKNDGLSTNQRRAIRALLLKSTVRAAAGQAGLSEGTLYRYLRNPVFKASLHKRQSETISAATAALSGLVGEAVETLRKVLEDKNASDAVRVRAALGILQERRRATELDELSERVSQLEDRLEKAK